MVDYYSVLSKLVGGEFDENLFESLRRSITYRAGEVKVAYVGEENFYTDADTFFLKDKSRYEKIPAGNLAVDFPNVSDGQGLIIYEELSKVKESYISTIKEYVALFESTRGLYYEGKPVELYKIEGMPKSKKPKICKVDKLSVTKVTDENYLFDKVFECKLSDASSVRILFDGLLQTFRPIAEDTDSDRYLFAEARQYGYYGDYGHEEVGSIKRVFVSRSHEDARLAVFSTKPPNRGYGMASYGAILAKTSNPLYDYLDEGRALLLDWKKTPNVVKGFGIVGIFDADIPFGLINEKDVDYESAVKDIKSKKKLGFITNQTLSRYLSPEVTQRVTKQGIDNKTVDKLKSKKFPIKINGLEMGKTYFEYDGLRIEAVDENSKEYLSWSWGRVVQNYAHEVESNRHRHQMGYGGVLEVDVRQSVNFNVLFEEFMSRVASAIHNWRSGLDRSMELKFGDVNINITKEIRGRASRYTINGIKINHKELVDCVRRGICYQTQEDFDGFLKIVSKFSLELHKIMSSGATAHIRITHNYDTSIELRFIRHKNRNYLRHGEQEIRINNLPTLAKKVQKCSSLNDLCRIFSTDRYFPDTDVDEDLIVALINEGKERYKQAIKKSEKLLEDTVKAVGGTMLENETVHGKTFSKAYKVKGISGNEYIVSENYENHHEGHCDVQLVTDDSLQYICIVDRAIGDQVGKDKIVNRLYALKNDSKVVGDIHTLASLV